MRIFMMEGCQCECIVYTQSTHTHTSNKSMHSSEWEIAWYGSDKKLKCLIICDKMYY